MRYERSFVIKRPIDEVWAFVKDLPFNLPRARGWVLGFRWTSPGPPGLGSTFQQRVVILGIEGRVTGAITEWDPPHSVTLSVSGAGIRSGFIRVTGQSTAEGTRVAIGIEFVPRPAFKPLWWIAGPFLKRQWDAGAQNLEWLFEAGR